MQSTHACRGTLRAVSPPLWHIWADRLDLGFVWAQLTRRWRQSLFLSHRLPSVHWAAPDVWAIVFLRCTVQECTHPLVTFDRLCGITCMSIGSPQRIIFPWQSIKKASLAECNVYSAGCFVCCRVQACSQLEVSWDSGDRVIKYFCMWLLLIQSSGIAYRFMCILQTGGSYYKKDLATFYGATQVISWSLTIDYFLTAACGPFWVNVNYMQNETAIQRLGCPNVWK